MFGIAILLSQTAWAKCDRELKALEGAAGEGAVAAYRSLAACDVGKAQEAFPAAVKRSGDVQSLTEVTLVAIEADILAPVHGMLEQIPDYGAREEAARAIGRECTSKPKVEAFVLGLHDAVKDRGFVGWAGALRSCESEGLTTRLEELAAAPPDRAFDDKYATVVELYARKQGVDALPVLEAAAAEAAGGGPFAVVIDAMSKAVTPEGIGGEPSAADRDALVAVLSSLGGAVSDADDLRRLASALVTVDAPDAAGALLPKLYPDRVQDGAFVYGLAATESCDDAAVVHWAVVEDQGQRWSIEADVDGPARAFKRRLKCDAEWTIQVTPEPVADEDEIDAWVEGIAEAAGEGAKLRGEKKITLQ